jgi:hypothetical protein
MNVDAEMKSPGEAKRFHGGFIFGNKQNVGVSRVNAPRFIKGDARAFGFAQNIPIPTQIYHLASNVRKKGRE